MKNPPDFVMYVVMVKLPGRKKFIPVWQWAEGDERSFAQGYARRSDAVEDLRMWQRSHGRKNAYIQQYGPYS